jgi:hypothetical protein
LLSGRHYVVKAKRIGNEENDNDSNSHNDNNSKDNVLDTLENEVQTVERTLIEGADSVGKAELLLVRNVVDYVTRGEEQVVQARKIDGIDLMARSGNEPWSSKHFVNC